MEPQPDSLAPYTERNGVNAKDEVEILMAGPEVILSAEELAEAKLFARELYEGKTPEAKALTNLNLEAISEIDATQARQNFYLGYFQTQEGLQDLISLGITDTSPSRIQEALLDIDGLSQKVELATIKKVAANSLNRHYKQQLAERLAKDPSSDVDYVDERPLSVNYEPERLVDKLEGLQAYRRFYKEIRAGLKQKQTAESTSNLVAAKKVLLDKYAARVNGDIASLYPEVMDLYAQFEKSEPTTANQELASRLKRINPIIHILSRREQIKQSQEFNDNLARRLDLLKRGAGEMVGGQLTPISEQLLMLAANLEQGSVSSRPEPLVDPKVIEKLKEIKWTPELIKDLFEDVLKDWRVLSDFQNEFDEIESRDGFAPDKKLQVAVHPRTSAHGVSSDKGVIWVPHEFDANSYPEPELGALPVIAHELAHALQLLYDLQLAADIPLAKIGGRRRVTLREGGAIHQETKVKNMFGYNRPTNLDYLKSLQAKLAGGNKAQVARAFFDSFTKGKNLNEAQQKSARLRAANRAQRLFRSGGHDSQPLDYIEQDLLWQNLEHHGEPVAEAISIAGTSFSLSDSADLHKIGLLDTPSSIRFRPAEDTLRIFTKKYLLELAS